MYDRLLNLWKQGKLDENGVNNAVIKGWITDSQKDEILATPKEDATN